MKKKKPPSLLLRITTRLSAVTLIAIALSYAWLLYQLHYTSDSLSEGSLIAQAGEIGRGMRLDDGALTAALSDDFKGSAAEREGKFRYAVTDDEGAVVFASKWAPAAIASVTLFDSRHNLSLSNPSQSARVDGFFGCVSNRSASGGYGIPVTKGRR